MKIISFGWTYPAIIAGRKTVTRRQWTAQRAKSFRFGELVQAYDRSPRLGGKKIAILKIIENPYRENIFYMPDNDYESEGFAYLNANPQLIPKAMKLDVSVRGFNEWRNTGTPYWVIRFEIIEKEV